VVTIVPALTITTPFQGVTIMTNLTNLQLAEKLFADTFHAQNDARVAVDAAVKILTMCEADMTIATGVLDRAIDSDLATR
jgi:hypothetical protein